MADLVPRQDISGMVDDELCEKQKDKSWKVRKEGLDNLNDDSFHIQLPPSTLPRFRCSSNAT